MAIFKRVLAIALSFAVAVMVPVTPAGAAPAAEPIGFQNQGAVAAPTSGDPSASDLEQLVAPIALYPDGLIAQVLAGATNPTDIVEAHRWIEENKNLQGNELAAAVDKQDWDPSIKGLTQFPQVLSNMNQNLSWTSALGDAYFNDSQGVMKAVQSMRKKAQDAGNLKSTPEQTVTTENQTIVIQPSNPEVVYVPSYNEGWVYGYPVAAYPGYYGWGAVAAGAVSFGVGMAMGAAFSNSWGWGGWGANWSGGSVNFNRNNYVSRSNTFANRNTRYNRATGGANINRGAKSANINRNLSKPSAGALGQASRLSQGQSRAASRGFGTGDRSSIGNRSGSFSGFSSGGSARMNSSRGSSSFGGGRSGGFGGGRSGGGGFRGGGGRR